MPAFGPISRRELIGYLRQAGFDGPYQGGRHQQMEKDRIRVVIPNPHRSDINRTLLTQILRQAQISREEWENL